MDLWYFLSMRLIWLKWIHQEKQWKNKDIIITKSDKGNGVVTVDWKLYDSAIQEIISDTSKFVIQWRPNHETRSFTTFFTQVEIKKLLNKNEYSKLYPPILLLLVSMGILKCTNVVLVIYFLNFIQLFRL